MMQTEVWKVFVQLGLPSCTSAITMRRVSAGRCWQPFRVDPRINIKRRTEPNSTWGAKPNRQWEIKTTHTYSCPGKPNLSHLTYSCSADIWSRIINCCFKPLSSRAVSYTVIAGPKSIITKKAHLYHFIILALRILIFKMTNYLLLHLFLPNSKYFNTFDSWDLP